MIPERLIDRNLISTKLVKKGIVLDKYTQYFYVLCIILRIFLGTLVFYNKIPQNIVYILSIIIIIIFSNKYIYNQGTWKNYSKTIISYSLLIIFTFNNKNMNNIGGVFVILDAILGANTRYITSNFKE